MFESGGTASTLRRAFESEVGVTVAGVHLVWLLAAVWGVDNTGIVRAVQFVTFLGGVAVLVLLGYRSRQLEMGNRSLWLARLFGWLTVFHLLVGLAFRLTAIDSTWFANTHSGRVLALFWAASLACFLVVLAAHIVGSLVGLSRGPKSSDEILEEVLQEG